MLSIQIMITAEVTVLVNIRSETPAAGAVFHYHYKQLVSPLFKASDQLPKQYETAQYVTTYTHRRIKLG